MKTASLTRLKDQLSDSRIADVSSPFDSFSVEILTSKSSEQRALTSIFPIRTSGEV